MKVYTELTSNCTGLQTTTTAKTTTSKSRILHPYNDALHHEPWTFTEKLNPQPFIQNPAPYTARVTSCTPAPLTLHPTSYTLHPTPYTMHPTLFIDRTPLLKARGFALHLTVVCPTHGMYVQVCNGPEIGRFRRMRCAH